MDRGEVCDRFLDTIEFDLYPFQEEALLAWFECEGGMLVSAPTGMGKTLIAEAAIFEALTTRRRLYYTTPLIALTDQKFREFQAKAVSWGFAADDIGLVTGNRRVNPNAPVRVVVAEILLNHLLADDETFDDVSGVVMDEFHYFNDRERGIVWELSLVLLPASVRLMLLSATVGNTADFVRWAAEQHQRHLRLIQTDQRRVPLSFHWVGDKLLTEHLPSMVSDNDEENRAPALVFCFNRDECWEVAERLKGLKLIESAQRAKIESQLNPDDFKEGIGPKLRQMLIRGVGVHHAGVLPKYKQIIEALFVQKLVPFVVCTETLAAGVNLPARSVVLSSLLKGKWGEKKLLFGSDAHQMFGRAGRPQYDTKGYVFAVAHDDDVKIDKWRKKYDALEAQSKDPNILRARKQLERKKPSRRKTVQYWTEGQLKILQESKPAKLASRSMIPYQVLVYLLSRSGTLHEVREFLSKRFTTDERITKFNDQLEHMLDNLSRFGFLQKDEDGEHVTVTGEIEKLKVFRSIDPLYGSFLANHLQRANMDEKIQALESVLPLPPALARKLPPPDHLEPGPMQTEVLERELIQHGILIATPDGGLGRVQEKQDYGEYWDGEDRHDEPDDRPMSVAEMLQALFDAKLASPEEMLIQPKWAAGGLFEANGEFYKFTRARDLSKNEGLLLRHLLRLVILTGEFTERSGGDPEYQEIGEQVTRVCQQIDLSYTDRFLAADADSRKLADL